MITSFDKALAAALVTLLVALIGHWGLHLSTDVLTAVGTLATAVVVWIVPNK